MSSYNFLIGFDRSKVHNSLQFAPAMSNMAAESNPRRFVRLGGEFRTNEYSIDVDGISNSKDDSMYSQLLRAGTKFLARTRCT